MLSVESTKEDALPAAGTKLDWKQLPNDEQAHSLLFKFLTQALQCSKLRTWNLLRSLPSSSSWMKAVVARIAAMATSNTGLCRQLRSTSLRVPIYCLRVPMR